MTAVPVGLVVLDRDGVLNVERAEPVRSPGDWTWERGAESALAALATAAVPVAIVTNQSAIGRGLVAADAVEAVHAWLTAELRRRGVVVSGIYVCPHLPVDGCDCRKPLPGMVRAALADAGVDAAACVVVGDDLRDLEAGRSAGARIVLVRTGKGASMEASVEPGTEVHDDVAGAVAAVVARLSDG